MDGVNLGPAFAVAILQLITAYRPAEICTLFPYKAFYCHQDMHYLEVDLDIPKCTVGEPTRSSSADYTWQHVDEYTTQLSCASYQFNSIGCIVQWCA